MQKLVLSAMDLRYFKQLNERQRRLFAAAKATELGWNGVALVSAAYGINRKTIYIGKKDLAAETLTEQSAIRSSWGKKKRQTPT
jgi:hypothetical protein